MRHLLRFPLFDRLPEVLIPGNTAESIARV